MLDLLRGSSCARWLVLLSAAGCGGAAGDGPPPSANPVGEVRSSESPSTDPPKSCGREDHVHAHDLSATGPTEAFAPCAKAGARDYSAVVKIETVDDGIHIVIDATDDEVTLLGPDAAQRDAVMVYPKGKGHPGIEVPLMKTPMGYRGDKIVFWDQLDRLTDDGTKLDVAIYDHDARARSTEEMHLAIAVSTGKSCERARDENNETIRMGSGRAAKDLTAEQLGAPMRDSAFMARCGLPDSSKADICVAVKKGRPVGVSVAVTPADRRVAACIDRATRRLSFPMSESLDVVHQRF